MSICPECGKKGLVKVNGKYECKLCGYDPDLPPAAIVGSLDDLEDVEIVSPADNEVPTYEAATALWKNKAPTGGVGSTVETAHIDTAAAQAAGVTWGDDAVCVLTLTATGKATKVVIWYSATAIATTGALAGVSIKVAGSRVSNTARNCLIPYNNANYSLATHHVYVWNGVSDLVVRGMIKGSGANFYERALSVVTIY